MVWQADVVFSSLLMVKWQHSKFLKLIKGALPDSSLGPDGKWEGSGYARLAAYCEL